MPPQLLWSGHEDARAESFQPLPRVFATDPRTNLHIDHLDAVNKDSHQIIIADNIDALRLFRHQHLLFHFIYIDPPYNTGQKLTFDDTHRTSPEEQQTTDHWLSMMYPRLSLAKDILAENGVMFISIDDREQSSLTLILREIFGRENHIGTLKWKKKRKPSFLDRHLSSVVEYILVFAKDAKIFPKLLGEDAGDKTRPVLNAANKICDRILRKGTPAYCKDGLYKKGLSRNRTLEIEFLNDFTVAKGILVNDVQVRGRFRVSQETLDRTVFISSKGGLRRIVEESELVRKHASDNCTLDWPTNEDGETEIRDIFGARLFEFAKPTGLIQRLLEMCQFPGETKIRCLDFFAGSGTLASAVVNANISNPQQKRCFFLVQKKEALNGIAVNAQFTHISDLTIARAQQALASANDPTPLQIIELIPQ